MEEGTGTVRDSEVRQAGEKPPEKLSPIPLMQIISDKGGSTMKNLTRFVMGVLFAAFMLAFAMKTAVAQDPVKVDPKHYKVEFENSQVRTLRIHYGPHEKSVMHGHPAGVGIFLTDNRAKFSLPDGKTEERSWKAGDTRWLPAEKHSPENLGDKPIELILVELKARPARAK